MPARPARRRRKLTFYGTPQKIQQPRLDSSEDMPVIAVSASALRRQRYRDSAISEHAAHIEKQLQTLRSENE